MLTKYRFTEDEPGYVRCGEDEQAQWYKMEDPSSGELSGLLEILKVPGQFLTDPLDPRERPRIDQEDGFGLIILSVPCVRPIDKGHSFSTVPLGVIICDGAIITVCSDVGLTGDLVNRWNKKPKPVNSHRLLLKILIESSIDFIRHLELMEEVTEASEKSLSKSQNSEQFMTLLSIDKALIVYNVALKSNRGNLTKLMEGHVFPFTQEELDFVDHALVENQQAIYMADIFGQVIGSLGDAFGNIINNNLNKIMKFLAGVTIILMLPTLVVGVYGMNIALPLADHPMAFWIICFFCLGVCGCAWYYFLRKRWI